MDGLVHYYEVAAATSNKKVMSKMALEVVNRKGERLSGLIVGH